MFPMWKNPTDKYASNSLWLLTERAAMMGLAFVSGILIARTFGPDDFGKLNYAIGFVQIFIFLSTLGIDPVVVKELVQRPEDHLDILGSALVMRLGGFCVMAVSVLAACFISGVSRESFLLILLVLGSGLGSALFSISNAFEAEMKNGLAAPFCIGMNLLFFALNCLGCFLRLPLLFFAFTNGAVVLCSAASKWLVYRRAFGQFPLQRADWGTMVRIGRKSTWLFGQLALTTFAANISYPVLKAFCSDQVIGFYAVTAKIEVCALVFAEVVAISMFPVIIRAIDRPEEFGSRLRRLYRIVFWTGVAAVPMAYLLGKPVIRLLYGPDFDEVGKLLWVAVMALPLNGLAQIFFRWCVIRRYEYAIVLQTFISAAAILICTICLSRRYGYAGAVWSIFAASAAQWLALLFVSGDIRGHVMWMFRNLFSASGFGSGTGPLGGRGQ